MNLTKEIVYTVLEILLCFIIIVFGYYIWNNFDLSSLEIAKSYSNYKEVLVDIDDIDNIAVLGNENFANSNTIYLHNTSSINNNVKLILKINKDNVLFKENTILKIDNNYYNLKELDYKIDNNYIYIIIDNYDFNSYETKELKLKILLKEEVSQNLGEYLNYEFITQV